MRTQHRSPPTPDEPPLNAVMDRSDLNVDLSKNRELTIRLRFRLSDWWPGDLISEPNKTLLSGGSTRIDVRTTLHRVPLLGPCREKRAYEIPIRSELESPLDTLTRTEMSETAMQLEDDACRPSQE